MRPSFQDQSNLETMSYSTVVQAFNFAGLQLHHRLSPQRFDSVLDELIARNYRSTIFNRDLSAEIFSLSRDRMSNEAPVENLVKYILDAYEILLDKISKLQRGIQSSRGSFDNDLERVNQLKEQCQCLLMAFGEKAVNGRAYGSRHPEIDLNVRVVKSSERNNGRGSFDQPIVISPIRQVQQSSRYQPIRTSPVASSRPGSYVMNEPIDQRDSYNPYRPYSIPPPSNQPYRPVYNYLNLYSQIRYALLVITTIFSLIAALHLHHPFNYLNSTVGILCIIVLITQFEGRLAVWALQISSVISIAAQSMYIYTEMGRYPTRPLGNVAGLALFLQFLTFLVAVHRLEIEKVREKSL